MQHSLREQLVLGTACTRPTNACISALRYGNNVTRAKGKGLINSINGTLRVDAAPKKSRSLRLPYIFVLLQYSKCDVILTGLLSPSKNTQAGATKQHVNVTQHGTCPSGITCIQVKGSVTNGVILESP